MEGHSTACLKHVLAMEGGFSNDPSDHGGATNWGIAHGVRGWFSSISSVPLSRCALLPARC